MTDCGISSYLIEYSKAVDSCLSSEYRDIIRGRLEGCAEYCLPVTGSKNFHLEICDIISELNSYESQDYLLLYLDEKVYLCHLEEIAGVFRVKKPRTSRARRKRFLCRICRGVFGTIEGLRDHFNNCECEVLVIANTDESRNAILGRNEQKIVAELEI